MVLLVKCLMFKEARCLGKQNLSDIEEIERCLGIEVMSENEKEKQVSRKAKLCGQRMKKHCISIRDTYVGRERKCHSSLFLFTVP